MVFTCVESQRGRAGKATPFTGGIIPSIVPRRAARGIPVLLRPLTTGRSHLAIVT